MTSRCLDLQRQAESTMRATECHHFLPLTVLRAPQWSAQAVLPQVVVLQDQAWPDDEPRDGSAGLAETHDPALRREHGERNRKIVEASYSIGNVERFANELVSLRSDGSS